MRWMLPLGLVVAGCVDVPGYKGNQPTGDAGHDGGTSDGGVTDGGGMDGGGTDGDVVNLGPPSCQGLAANCGANALVSCCESRTVEASTYFRSHLYDHQTAPATVRAFSLDTFEVTVGRFRKFVEAGKGVRTSPPAAGAGSHPWIAGSGWNAAWSSKLTASRSALETALACEGAGTWTANPGANELLPITCVGWFEAMAFCAWDGGFLPTEAEWNAAAVGGAQQRNYPWSTPPGSEVFSHAHASFCDSGEPSCPSPHAVGTKPMGVGRWGHHDLGGNAYEPILDTMDTYPMPCVDCASLSTSSTATRVYRGGYFASDHYSLTGSIREDSDPNDRFPSDGIRCARAL